MDESCEADEAEDIEIINRVLRGRVDDFEILLERYRGYVFKIVSGFLPLDEVREISHDVFVEVYRSLPNFDFRTSFRKWLAGIAIHLCHDYWRKHYRNREIPLSSLSEEYQNWVEGVLAAQSEHAFGGNEQRKEAREVLQWALAGLSAEDRMVLILVHLEGLTAKEAAELLGWSMVNVKVRAYRSRSVKRSKRPFIDCRNSASPTGRRPRRSFSRVSRESRGI